jgi:hypothetical protein
MIVLSSLPVLVIVRFFLLDRVLVVGLFFF